ncbi:LPP20 family lipoprotein [Oceanicoccus sp. KOV_DT_Chl]|uniref:LPP20 family lipoprotein n=1 Tax=Oceanicoccus sp. KOV_DT_Chl TaxID=1904639 RepID=UPI0011AEE4AF|nr:LPP20 family lipoprotein [Oceanicoccus sp. KOV_DT_Chl]
MKTITTLTSLIIFTLLNACSSQTTVESDLGINGAPDWVNQGTQAIDNNDGRLIHGVGMAPPMGDSSLQKNTASNRARAEIANILKSYIDSNVKDYTASRSDTGAQMSIEREIKVSTQLALSGSRVLGYWKDDNTGDIYAFAELNFDSIEELITHSDQLSESFKQFYQANNNANFERFVKSQQALSQ